MTKLTMLMATVATSALLAGCGMFDGNRSTASRQTNSSTAQVAPNPQVREVQQALNGAGFYTGESDGVWGPRTSDALRNFQAARGLEQTGQLDNRTLAALNVRYDGSTQTGAAPSGSNWGTPVTSPSTTGTSPGATGTAGTTSSTAGSSPYGSTAAAPPAASGSPSGYGTTGRTASGTNARGNNPPAGMSQGTPRGTGNTTPYYSGTSAGSNYSGAPPRGTRQSASGTSRSSTSSAMRADVREAQQELQQAGYDPGPIDGIWGPRTQRATRDFQQARGLPASGTLDQRTMSELRTASSAIGTSRPGTTTTTTGTSGTTSSPTVGSSTPGGGGSMGSPSAGGGATGSGTIGSGVAGAPAGSAPAGTNSNPNASKP